MKYMLLLVATNGEEAKLYFETFKEASIMRNSFMLMGQYTNATISEAYHD